MKPPLLFILLFLILSAISSPISISAHFFPNVSSIPSSAIPNVTVWDAFTKLAGCRKGQNVLGLSAIKTYFRRFGYLHNSYNGSSDDFDDFLESAVKTYQTNFNLNATGELDVQTLKRVVLPRCGNADIINGTSTMNSGKPPPFGNASTVAHYSFFPNRQRWPPSRSELTYAFLPENQLTDGVKQLFARAFERWSEVTPLTFTEAPSYRRADIQIGFFPGDHGDGEPFDGAMGTLAHAFAPTNGRFHLDLDENWVLDGDFLNSSPATAVDLESVAVHEIGHILGLGHSSVEDAIMFPSIAAGTRKVELANDDVLGIQELYGSNPNYTGSFPDLNPRGERGVSGTGRVDCSLVIGLLLLFSLVVLLFL